MRYLKRLTKSLTDDKDVAVELMLLWIGAMLTLLVVLGVLYYVIPGG